MFKKQLAITGLFLGTINLVTACGGGSDGPKINVGSKAFTEQSIIGNMYEMVLDDAGFDADYSPIGGTNENHAALTSGEIDVYPEYIGSALTTILGQEFNPDMSAEQIYQTVKEDYAAEFDVAVLEPTSFNNTYAIVMPKDRANELGIKTLSDISQKANELTLGTTVEFAERGDGLPGLKNVYGGMNFKEVVALDPGLLYSGIDEGEIDVTSGFGTDGQIEANNLVALEDDKNLWPPYPAAAFVRQEVLEEHPKVADKLNQVAQLLDSETMRNLNWEVAGNGKEASEVAREFLEQKNILTAEN